MKFLAHCILRAPTKSRQAALLGERFGSTFFSSAGLAIVVSEVEESGRLPMEIDAICAFEALTARLHNQTTVIPIRYGSLFRSASEITRHLELNGDVYRKMMAKLDGCTEMAVTVLLSTPMTEEVKLPDVSTTEGPGTSYLKNLSAARFAEESKQRIARSTVSKLRKAYGDLARDLRIDIEGLKSMAEPTARVSFLLPRESVAEFRQRFRHLKATSQEGAFLTGPVPPYSFVG